jgi:membrane protein
LSEVGVRESWQSRIEGVRRSLLGRAVSRFVTISGYDRSLALATQAFVALVPAAILAGTYLPDARRSVGGSWLVERLGLTGGVADAVELLVELPPTNTAPTAVAGVVLVVMTGIGFTRTLQRVYVAAWVLSPLGVGGFLRGLLAVAVLVGAIVTVVAWHPGVDGAEMPLVAFALHAVLAVVLWLPVQRLLLGGRIGWRQLLPGALVAGLGQVIVMGVSGLYFQVAIASQAERFGVIGVAFVLVSWLVVLAYLLVGAAVLSAEMAGAPLPPARAAPPTSDVWSSSVNRGRAGPTTPPAGPL